MNWVQWIEVGVEVMQEVDTLEKDGTFSNIGTLLKQLAGELAKPQAKVLIDKVKTIVAKKQAEVATTKS